MKKEFLVFVLISFILAGCTSQNPGGDKTPVQSTVPAIITQAPTSTLLVEPAMEITATVMGENPHAVGGVVLLVMLKPTVDAPNTNVTIKMPSEATMLTGSLAWAGDLKANQALYLNLTVDIPALAKASVIQIESVSYPSAVSKFGKTYVLYVRPTPDGKLEFSATPF